MNKQIFALVGGNSSRLQERIFVYTLVNCTIKLTYHIFSFFYFLCSAFHLNIYIFIFSQVNVLYYIRYDKNFLEALYHYSIQMHNDLASIETLYSQRMFSVAFSPV